MKQRLSLMCLLILLMLTGCGISGSEAPQIIEDHLEQRYHDDFQIQTVVKDDYEADGEIFNTSIRWVATVVHPQTGTTFTAYCTFNGKGVRDYYAQSLYTQALSEKMDEIFADSPNIYVRDNLKLKWCPSPEDWQPDIPFEEAFETWELYELDLDVVVPAENAPERAEALAQLLARLHPEHNQMCLNIFLSDEDGNVSCSYAVFWHKEKKNAQTIRARLERLCQTVAREPELKQLLRDLQADYPFIQSTRLSGLPSGNFEFALYLSEADITVRTDALYEIYRTLKTLEPEGILRVDNALGGITLTSLRLELTREEFEQRLLKPAAHDEITPITTAPPVTYPESPIKSP